ncbi:hypothetical protein [Streptomyces sp. NPDC020965]|uniref:hypothetical protein n=1 Tax=Streptomyces sp. NPDC020965 TaxID=3365105 RepID=UPI0037AE2CB4
MEAIIAVLALLFVVLVAFGTVKAVRAAKRGVERTVSQARRTVEDTTLRAKTYGQGGVAGELAQLRLSLRTSMRSTQDALRAGAEEDSSLSESLALFERLSAHGRELDDELKRLEREPDRSTVSGRIPELRERTERITHSAESLRWAARDRAQRFADDDLDTLSAQIDMEAGALRHWSASEADTVAAPGAPAAEWPKTAASGATGSEQSRPASDAETGDRPGQAEKKQDQPQAITARDPQQQTTYSWQKTPRPETTN